MDSLPFVASQCSPAARELLFASAFWTFASDEQLKPSEQMWLDQQFGPEESRALLAHFLALDNTAFFQTFDQSAAALTDDDKQRIYPGLLEWLRAGRSDAPALESDVLMQIRQRLQLDVELQRLLERRLRILNARTLPALSSEIMQLAFASPSRLYCASEDGSVTVWDPDASEPVCRIPDHGMGASAVLPVRDTLAVSSDRMGTLRAWDPASGKSVWLCSGKKRGGITALALSPDGTTVYAATDTGVILSFATQTGTESAKMDLRRFGAILALQALPDGRLLCGGDDRILRLIDPLSAKVTGTLSGHQDGITGLSLVDGGKSALSSSRDNTLRLWSLPEARCLRVYSGHRFSVMAIAAAEGDRLVASASWDHTLRIWDLDSGVLLSTTELPDLRYSAVCFAPGRRVLAAGDSGGRIQLLDYEAS